MAKDIIITPASGKIDFLDNSVSKASLTLDSNNDLQISNGTSPATFNTTTAGASVLKVTGTNGTLFEITDDLSSSLMSVNTIAGLPVLEVFSDYHIVAGRYNQNDFYLNTNGNLGLGTASPSQLLQIVATNAANNGITLQNTNSSGNSQVRFLNTSGSERAAITYINSSDAVYHYTSAGGNLLNLVGANVGIGTASPTAKLHVNGTFVSNAIWTDSSSITYWGGYASAFGGLTWNTGMARVFANTGNRLELAANLNVVGVAIDTSGNVGIGTSNPVYNLDIVGSGGADDRVFLRVKSNASSGDGDAILYLDSAQIGESDIDFMHDGSLNWRIRTGDAAGSTNTNLNIQNASSNNVLTLEQGGFVGVGTNNPERNLHVFKGESSGAAANSDSTLVLENSSHTYVQFLTPTTSESGLLFGDSDNDRGALTYNHNTDSMNFRIAANTRMFINSSGNVGIGQTSPVTKLHIAVNNSSVHAPTAYTNNGVKALTLRTQEGDGLEWHLAHSTNGYTGWVAAARVNNTGGNWGNGYLEFTTASSSSGAGNANVLVLTGTGNVGIGTASTSQKLHVSGNSLVTGNTYIGDTNRYFQSSSNGVQFQTAHGYIFLGPDNASWAHIQTDRSSFYFNKSLAINGGMVQSYDENLVLNAAVDAARAIEFRSGGTTYMYMTAGSLGIGTTSPSYKLDVNGTVRISSTLTMNNANITNINNLVIADPGAGEGLSWSGSSWMIDVSPLNRANTDGNLNLYNSSSNNIALWRPSLWVYDASNYATATANSDGSLTLTSTNTGDTIFSVDGSNGTLFSVVDDLSDSLMSVNDAAGLPVLEVFADSHIVAGRYGQNDFYLDTNGNLGLGTASPTSAKLEVRGRQYNLHTVADETVLHLYNSSTSGYGTYIRVDNSDVSRYALRIDNGGSQNLTVPNSGGLILANLTDNVDQVKITRAGYSTTHADAKLYIYDNSNADWAQKISLDGYSYGLRIDGFTTHGLELIHTSLGTVFVTTSSELVVNQAGANYDFRVQGDTDTSLLVCDASADRVGIGTSSPSQKLHVVGGNIHVGSSGSSFLVSNGYGYFQDYSSYGARLGRISFINMNSGGSNWDNYAYHGIGSTDASANFGDSISINSYNDITLRLDSNNNNSASYFRIMNNTTGNNIISYIGFDGTYSTAQLPSFVGVNSGPTTSYNLNVNGSVNATTYYGNGSNLTSVNADTVDGYQAANLQKIYTGTVTFQNSYVNAFKVTGGSSLSSAIRVRVSGTSGNVVVTSILDIVVCHSADISITSQSGNYTELTVKVTSDNNQNYDVAFKHNGSTSTSVGLQVLTYNNESITFTSSTTYSSTSLEHVAKVGSLSTSSTGGTGLTVQDNVGIGTTNPSQKLHVIGNTYIAGNLGIGTSSPTGNLHIQKSTAGALFESSGSTNYTGITYLGDTSNNFWSSSLILNNANGIFEIRNNSSSAAIAINTSGNVGINTTSPTQKLHVNGNVTATAYYGDGSNLTGISTSSSSNTQSQKSGTTTLTLNVGSYALHVVPLANGTTISSITYSSAPSSGTVSSIIVILKYSGTATVTWTNVIWSGGVTPTLTGSSGKGDVFSLTSYNGGSNWIGAVVAQNLDSTNL